MDYASKLSKEFTIRADHAQNIISLIDEGNTIPFIARYRKEMTGSCDDQVLREFHDRLKYLRNLDKRKEEIVFDGYAWVSNGVVLTKEATEVKRYVKG